jgi:hypothetical protein
MNEIMWHESAVWFLLHRNCFLLINMLENFIKFQNHKIKKKNQNYKNFLIRSKHLNNKFLELF